MQEIPPLLSMTNEEYHSDNIRISNSGISLLVSKTPAHYFARYLAPDREPNQPTPAMELGTLSHTAILEPHLSADWLPMPKFDGRTNAGKAALAEFLETNAGRKCVPAGDYETVSRMRDAVHNHPGAAYLLNADGRRIVEGTAHFTEPESGAACKVRPDLLTLPESDLWNVDLKTTEDASPAEFNRSVAKFGYHRQAPFYLDGVAYATGERPRQFAFIAVEKRPPYGVAVYYLSEATLEYGREEYLRQLRVYAECRRLNQWPGYPVGLQELTLPKWAFKQLDA